MVQVAYTIQLSALNGANGFRLGIDAADWSGYSVSDAAREIGGIIGESTAEVNSGVRQVTHTGDALGEIYQFVAKIDGNIDDIAIAASEQTNSLDQINASIGEIDKMTQNNAAMVEETAAISMSLQDGSKMLSELVGRFKLGAVPNVDLRAVQSARAVRRDAA